MNQFWHTLLTCTLALSMGSALAAKPVWHFTDPNKPIELSAKAPEFQLVLQSNMTTGFSWFLTKNNDALIQPISHRYVASSSKLVGAPGVELWTFKATTKAVNVPRIMSINLEYTRPWSLSSGHSEVFHIVVHG